MFRLFVNLVLSTSYRLPNASSWIIVLIKSSIFAQSGTYFIGWQCEYYCILLSSCSVANRCTAKQLTRINLIVCYRCFIATIQTFMNHFLHNNALDWLWNFCTVILLKCLFGPVQSIIIRVFTTWLFQGQRNVKCSLMNS